MHLFNKYFLKIFLGVLLAVAIVFPFFVYYYLFPTIRDYSYINTETRAIRVAEYLKSDLMDEWPNRYSDISSLKSKYTSDEVAQYLHKAKNGLGIMKIKIFNKKGTVLYSTEEKDIGTINVKDYFNNIVQEGEVFTNIIKKGTKTIEGRPAPANIVETCVPIMNNASFAGAFEIYYDITADEQYFSGVLKTVMAITLTTSLLAILSFFTIILKIRKIKKERVKSDAFLRKTKTSLEYAYNNVDKARKKSDSERQKSETIINNFADPIIVLDRKERIAFYNPAADKIFQINKEHIKMSVAKKNNYSMNNFKHLLKAEYTTKPSVEVSSDNCNIEEVAISAGGLEHIYKVITIILSPDDEFSGIIKVFYDITREVQMDKLKTEFMSIAAHQLRTPLSAIKWSIEMVLNRDIGAINDEQERILSRGQISNERLIRLIDDLLNVSRIEEGRYRYTMEPCNFLEIIDVAIETVKNKASKKNIELEIKKPGKLPVMTIDKEKMIIVVENLLENAIKYTPKQGKVKLVVSVSGPALMIKVIDTGVGIPKEDQVKLFTKFFRAENAIRMQIGGTGLGLFIVKSIVNKHGGKISCTSEDGRGTEFKVVLPLDLSQKT